MNRGRRGAELDLVIHPLTTGRWLDFEELFGPRGACGGCWCMWFRLSRRQFDLHKGEGNRRAMHDIVFSCRVPGILAYHDATPVGWCSLAPREEFSRLERSRILSPVDDRRVWSIVCLFVARRWRRHGVSTQLLAGAVDYVRDLGGTIVEGYPVEPKEGRMPDTFAYHGLAEAFRRVGFREVARRSETRPIMRYVLRER